MRVALVTTTINVPTLLDAYVRDAVEQGHRDLGVIVIGDRKTPAEAGRFCEALGRRYGPEVVFLDVEGQVRYLVEYPELAEHLPYDSIQRRNIGLLLAYERGAEIVITIDDDNFLAEPDFIGSHLRHLGAPTLMEGMECAQGWLNVCAFLEEQNGFRFYHRGFPPGARIGGPELHPSVTPVDGRVVVNAGLWLEDPDIDAVTRLAVPLNVTGYGREQNFALAEGPGRPSTPRTPPSPRTPCPPISSVPGSDDTMTSGPASSSSPSPSISAT